MTSASEIRAMVDRLKQYQSGRNDITSNDEYIVRILEMMAYKMFELENKK